jgi:hypothetical protein
VLPQAGEIARAFDDLAIASQPAFTQLIRGGRLRYTRHAESGCDVIDDYSCRLICQSIASQSPLLIIWPDMAERRAPLALAAAVICDAVLRIGSGSERARILYIGSDASIREQFGSLRIGRTAIASVFAQEWGRRDNQLLRVGPESSLPVVTTIVSPADPGTIIAALQPRWIAVDCSRGNPPPWLPGLLSVAKAIGIPVIGWSTLHLSPVADLWRAQGACVYRWPKVEGVAPLASLDDLDARSGSTEVTPLVMGGDCATQVSAELAQAYQRLARHAGHTHGQLARDALSVGWKYLRLLESVPVPLSLYDAECGNYWGAPALGRLKAAFERFVQALDGNGRLHTDLSFTYERLAAAHGILQNEGDPPLWLATATLAIEAAQSSLFVFRSRAHRELFQFALLSRANISEDDLRGIGVSLCALSDLARREPEDEGRQITLIGLPSRVADWRIESLLSSRSVRVIVWPHLEDSLQRRATDWSEKLTGGCDGPSPLKLVAAGTDSTGSRVRVARSRPLRPNDSSSVAGPLPAVSGQPLWKRPEAAEAIRALFAAQDVEDDASDEATNFTRVQDGPDGAGETNQDDWTETAVRAVFDDGGEILLPLDDYVNVITRTLDGVSIVPRFSRSLRVGDELLLVHGEHRRGLYGLLVSRVHSHPTIAPWLSLIDRWHQDLRRTFLEHKRRSGLTFESLLEGLRSRGSAITTAASVRGWVIGATLAPSDRDDIRRLGEILDITTAKQYAREIGNAAGRLAGLHRSLSQRLNRWLASEDAGAATLSSDQAVVDAELGLTVEDFRHSIVRGRVASVAEVRGPFLRSHIGHLRRGA